MKSPLEILQPLGRALMLPIAVLPVAGLLLRFGQPDLLNIPFIAAAGEAIFLANEPGDTLYFDARLPHGPKLRKEQRT